MIASFAPQMWEYRQLVVPNLLDSQVGTAVYSSNIFNYETSGFLKWASPELFFICFRLFNKGDS